MNDRPKGDRKSCMYLDESKLHPKLFELIRQMQTQSWTDKYRASFSIENGRKIHLVHSTYCYYSNIYRMYLSEASRKPVHTLAPPIAMGK